VTFGKTMTVEIAKSEERESSTGGCSLGCASIFVFALFIWPALHVIGRTYEPDILLPAFAIGVPSFVVGNILAVLALRSKSAKAWRLGKWALRIMWSVVVLFLLLAVVAFTMEKLGGKS